MKKDKEVKQAENKSIDIPINSDDNDPKKVIEKLNKELNKLKTDNEELKR